MNFFTFAIALALCLFVPARGEDASVVFVPFPNADDASFVVAFTWKPGARYPDYQTAALSTDNSPEVAWSKYHSAMDKGDLDGVVNACVEPSRDRIKAKLANGKLEKISQARKKAGVKIALKGIVPAGKSAFVIYTISSQEGKARAFSDKVLQDKSEVWGVDPREAINSIPNTLLGMSVNKVPNKGDGFSLPAPDYTGFFVREDAKMEEIKDPSVTSESVRLFINNKLFAREKIRLSKYTGGVSETADFLKLAYQAVNGKDGVLAQSYFYHFEDEKDKSVAVFNWDSRAVAAREDIVYFLYDLGGISYFVLGDETGPRSEGFIVKINGMKKICTCNRLPLEGIDAKNAVIPILAHGSIIKDCLRAKESNGR